MGHGGVTIESSEECRPQKVILEKPSVEMRRHIKFLYVRAHLNGRPVSKVLMDNGSVVIVMPLRMLRALGRSINDLIETKVVMSAFTGDTTYRYHHWQQNCTICLFVIYFTANYNILLGRDWIHANWCVSSSLYQFLLSWKGNEVELVQTD